MELKKFASLNSKYLILNLLLYALYIGLTWKSVMMDLEDEKMSKVFRNIQFGIFSCISKWLRVEDKELLCLQSVLCMFVCELCLILREQIKLEIFKDSEEKFDSKKDELTKILGFYTTKNFLISGADEGRVHSFDLRI
jgi:hypothetical protein